jgi:hypothetical protein
MWPNNSCIYRKSKRDSNKCVAKLLCKHCIVKGLLIWAFFIAAGKSYVFVTNIFKICYKRYLSFRLQKINEKSRKRSGFFRVKKWMSFQFFKSRTEWLSCLKKEGRFSKGIFKMEFRNKEALNGNGFSTQTPKMWHKCGINWKEKPVRSSKWITYGNFEWR